MQIVSRRGTTLIAALIAFLVAIPAVATGATCLGCDGHRRVVWTDYLLYEKVNADHTNNHADEIIDRQHVHAALVQNTANKNCYEGDIVWNDSWTGDNREDSPILSSGYHTGWSDTWTHASGHDWWDDGSHWIVDEANDWCKSF